MSASCERCGQSFAGRRASARFCSDACRQAAWRERQGGAGIDVPLEAVAGGDAPVLVVEAVEESPRAGLVALAGWLAETLDGLEGAARAVHGPKVAGQLTAVLKALAPKPASAKPDARSSALDKMREERARENVRSGRFTG